MIDVRASVSYRNSVLTYRGARVSENVGKSGDWLGSRTSPTAAAAIAAQGAVVTHQIVGSATANLHATVVCQVVREYKTIRNDGGQGIQSQIVWDLV